MKSKEAILTNFRSRYLNVIGLCSSYIYEPGLNSSMRVRGPVQVIGLSGLIFVMVVAYSLMIMLMGVMMRQPVVNQHQGVSQ
ncbi:hypothetical protein DUE52_21920 [Larkinella punicea]|uniref:Uncharacterized protein n=1 Tax=Larkinella punicea TaxID=2315727 RepID=A0A368JIU8_9BACT|nr:hypothetical protein DUE52_21920 [Larkinella punicea]